MNGIPNYHEPQRQLNTIDRNHIMIKLLFLINPALHDIIVKNASVVLLVKVVQKRAISKWHKEKMKWKFHPTYVWLIITLSL